MSADPPLDDSINRSAYDAVAMQWDRERFRLEDDERRILDLALADMQPGSSVLDLGCGTGRPIGEFVIAKGFALTGVDASPRMLELARARFPDARWLEERIEQFVARERFHSVLAWDCLFHIPRVHHRAIFEQVRDALLDNGSFALTVGGSEHPAFTDTMFGRSFFYDSHAPDAVVALLRAVGFEIEHSEFLDLPSCERDKGRFAIVARAVVR